MLMPRPVFRHCRHHPFDVNNFSKLPLCGVISPPRSISDERHDDESSKLEPRRCRLKQAQFRSIMASYTFIMLQIVFAVSIFPYWWSRYYFFFLYFFGTLYRTHTIDCHSFTFFFCDNKHTMIWQTNDHITKTYYMLYTNANAQYGIGRKKHTHNII